MHKGVKGGIIMLVTTNNIELDLGTLNKREIMSGTDSSQFPWLVRSWTLENNLLPSSARPAIIIFYILNLILIPRGNCTLTKDAFVYSKWRTL